MNGCAILAHRGDTEHAPENTMAAFTKALNAGYDLEFDIDVSKDGHLVIIHDDTVDRTTDGHGMVSDLTLEELRMLDAGRWRGLEFRGERIPTFRELLKLVKGSALLAINFKREGTEELIAEALKGYPDVQNTFIFDIPAEAARKLKSVHPNLPVAARASKRPEEDFFRVTQQRFPEIDVIWADETCGRPFITAEIVEICHGAGKRIYATIVNDPTRMDELIKIEIDGICTDRPSELKRIKISLLSGSTEGGNRK